MMIQDGWFVLYQPDYATPCVFDLHERGLFTSKPRISGEWGARLEINEKLRVRIEYMHLRKRDARDRNVASRYSYITRRGVIDLPENLLLNQEALADSVADDNLREEIIRVYETWFHAYVPRNPEGRVEPAELERKLTSSLKDCKKRVGERLIRKNSEWIESVIPWMTHTFRYGLYLRVSEKLYPDYRERGGKDTENGLIRKIQLFNRIFENAPSDLLAKPDGRRWKNEDEAWYCWVAYAGSENEARRVCRTMDAVLRPLWKNWQRITY